MYQATRWNLVRIGGGALSVVGLAALIGCAVGSDPGVDVSTLDSLPVEAGAAVDSAATTLPTTTPHTGDMTPGDDAGDEEAGTGTGSDAGTDAAGTVDAGGGVDAGGTTSSCASGNICTGATDLGTISGDTGADVKTASGTGSHWFTIRVTENDSSVTGLSLLAKAELISPAGANFDLYVYLAGGSSGQECSAVKSSSTNASGLDSTTIEWGESGLFSNGSDDSRTVTVEVRWVSGTCSAASPWSLTVRGDTP